MNLFAKIITLLNDFYNEQPEREIGLYAPIMKEAAIIDLWIKENKKKNNEKTKV